MEPGASADRGCLTLAGQWCGASANKAPTARATFGTYRSTNKFIFQRENY